MVLTKSHKIKIISLVLLILVTQAFWWLFPAEVVRAAFFMLGAWYWGLLWAKLTEYIERRL